jgi:hypothetical protein
LEGGGSVRKGISKIEVETIVLILISIVCWLIIQPSPSNPLQEKELIKAFWKGMKEEEMLARARKLDLPIQAVYSRNEAPRITSLRFAKESVGYLSII